MNKKVVKRIIGGLIAVLVIVATFISGFFTAKNYYLTNELESIKFIIDTYKKYYYQEQENLPHLFADALMDEYSQFYTEEEYKLSEKASKGYRQALGISVTDELVISKVLYNSPADNAGIKTGGKIMLLDGVEVTNKTQLENINANQEITLTISYADGNKNFTLLKTEFTETFVRYYDNTTEYSFSSASQEITAQEKAQSIYNLDDKTGYLIYRGFSAINSTPERTWKDDLSTSAGQFAYALKKFNEKGKTNLIIDLRDNGGGYMTILSSVVSHFIEGTSRALISEARYKGEKTERFYSLAPCREEYNFEKITVLCNQNTASASEAFVGALLDYDDENVVEVVVEYNPTRKNYSSFGKGIMQSTVVNTITNQALKLTVAEIYWPISDISIHGKGVSTQVSSKVKESKNSLGEPIDALDYVLN